MSHLFVFQVRTLGIEKGFELSCEGVLEHPLQPMRLIDAVVHATQLARHLRARIEIFDSYGELAEIIELNGPQVAHHYCTSLAA